ncbi:hypothetical protein SAMN05428989_1205 [Pseudoxanthomonas sp. GM95]|uniref:DUF6644 family protein n=1 Tax=Pseudoxanthomonas sp. GM95 TaxID=1881043 RepID=UPI0008CCE555|nr:DUF6644 family protein [Pseudoxanthomonas sp. GM95]SEK98547.1 hypothetical protein SAMN05428989_1205 [Pseudoxanthomonas sp. GM95]
MDLMPWMQALEDSALGQWMRAGWGYPAANVLHLVGLVLLVGPICLLDLRLLGLGRSLNALQVSRLLTPWAISGLLLTLATGVMLFAADASALLGNRMMQFKLLAVTLAVLNALLFRARHAHHLPHWDRHPPPIGKLSAALSLCLWPAVLVAGRMIAYT